jgi:hypothetical protein
VLIVQLWRRKLSFRALLPLGAAAVALWLVHIPMPIQARYMVPVHLFVLTGLALGVLTALRPGADDAPESSCSEPDE